MKKLWVQEKGNVRKVRGMLWIRWMAMIWASLIWLSVTSPSAEAASPVKLGGETRFSGESMVWFGLDANGQKQVFYKNLSTGETRQLTHTSSYKTSLHFGGELVVWLGKPNADGADDWQVYGYNVTTGEERRLSEVPSDYKQTKTDGRYVTWQVNDGSFNMYLYDWAEKNAAVFGKGTQPIVAQGKVLFKPFSGNGLSVYDIAAHKTAMVLTLPNSDYISWFGYNGSTALVKQNNRNDEAKYVLLNFSQQQVQSKDLTSYMKRQREFGTIVVGDRYVSWMEDKNGVAQVMVADVKEGRVTQLTQATVDQRPLAFSGDMLLVNQVFEGIATYTDVPAVVASLSGSRSSSPVVVEEKQGTLTKVIGPEGGVLQSTDGRIRAEFGPGVFTKETKVDIHPGAIPDAPASESGKMLSPLSGTWEISAGEPFAKRAMLTLAYDGSRVLPEQMKKLGLYRYNTEQQIWQYVGGRVDSKERTVRAELLSGGKYAVLLYDAAFADMEGHWARQSVEVLASRWIINGMTEDAFQPDAKLTRAQFTKMLSAAMGLKPVHSDVVRFPDVTSGHWGYGWIEAASQAGLVEGGTAGFEPESEISREQMMTMLIRALGKTGEAQQLGEEEKERLLAFSDTGDLSSWAKANAALAVKLGLVQGSEDGLAPKASSTRAEAAAVLFRLLTKQNQL